jgi:SPP1 gp7 family putative phage head morphogenesis protein
MRTHDEDNLRRFGPKGNPFEKSRWIEEKYARELRDVARQIGRIIGSHDPMSMSGLETMQRALEQYANILRPWALRTAAQTAQKLDGQDRAMWMRQSVKIGVRMREIVENDPAGAALRDFIERQVHYISSLPIEEGRRVQKLAIEAKLGGKRPDEIAEELANSGQVTQSRATLIARTEIARAGSVLTETRATALGATHYVWRTSKDKAVRKSHREMEGKVCEIGKPPTLSDGTTTAPGQIYNCRCTAQIILPDL